jgi:hypothetical protein
MSSSFLLPAVLDRLGLGSISATSIVDSIIPQPYRSILMQKSGMTRTLEEIIGEPITLSVSQSFSKDFLYSRHSVLASQSTKIPLEFAAIEVYLEHLPASARSLLMKEKIPFGTVLSCCGVTYISAPIAFFEVMSGSLPRYLSNHDEPCRLYGRWSRLIDSNGKTLAETIEILSQALADH